MSHYYLDSSALVKKYIQELGTPEIRGLLETTDSNTFYTAIISKVEVTSAFARRMRDGSLSAEYADNTFSNFYDDFDFLLNVMSIDAINIDQASTLTRKHMLRAYDAVQLSSALQMSNYLSVSNYGSLVFVSGDKGLLIAAQAEGLVIKDPNEKFTQ